MQVWRLEIVLFRTVQFHEQPQGCPIPKPPSVYFVWSVDKQGGSTDHAEYRHVVLSTGR